MRSSKKNIRIKSIILSTFLTLILFSYNNCSRLRPIGEISTKKSVPLKLMSESPVHEYRISFNEHELRFRGAKLDNKIYSISDLSLYPHSDAFNEVVFYEKGRELVVPLRINSDDPLRNSALLRLKKKNSNIRVFLR